MKKFPFALLSVLFLFSCSKKEKHETEPGEWKELDDFHTVMAKAYHPLKDSGNVAPVKLLINELADKADKLSSSLLPKKVDNAEMKSRLEKLKADAHGLATEISHGATDDSIKEKLNSLHDQFHKILEAWHNRGDDEDDEGEDHDEHDDH